MRRWALPLLLLLPAPVSAEFNLAYWQTFSSRAIREFNNALTAASRFGVPRYATAALPTCNALNEGALAFDTTTDDLLFCDGTAYVAAGGSSGGTCPNAVAGQVLFQSGTDCAGDTDLTFATATLLGTNITGGTLLNAIGPNGTANAVYMSANTLGFEGATANTNDFSFVSGDHSGNATLTITGAAASLTMTPSTALWTLNGVQVSLATGPYFLVDGNTGGVIVGGNFQYGWADNATAAATPADTGFAKTADGVIRATNGSTGIGYFKSGMDVEVSIVSKTPTAIESGEVYTNTGDADGSTFTLLDNPTIGVVYTVVATAAQNITITAAAGETLQFGNAACATSLVVGGAATGIGDSVTILAATGGSGAIWIVIAFNGTPVCT